MHWQPLCVWDVLIHRGLCSQGSSQIRQSFSKRKRGIAQKAFQLYKITDAKVDAKSLQTMLHMLLYVTCYV